MPKNDLHAQSNFSAIIWAKRSDNWVWWMYVN